MWQTRERSEENSFSCAAMDPHKLINIGVWGPVLLHPVLIFIIELAFVYHKFQTIDPKGLELLNILIQIPMDHNYQKPVLHIQISANILFPYQ